MLGHRQAAAEAGVPSVLILFGDGIGGQDGGDPGAVGIGGQIPVFVGGDIHLGLDLLEEAVLGVPGQVEDQRQRLAGGGRRRDVEPVAAGPVTEGEVEGVGAVGTARRGQDGPGGGRHLRCPGHHRPRGDDGQDQGDGTQSMSKGHGDESPFLVVGGRACEYPRIVPGRSLTLPTGPYGPTRTVLRRTISSIPARPPSRPNPLPL